MRSKGIAEGARFAGADKPRAAGHGAGAMPAVRRRKRPTFMTRIHALFADAVAESEFAIEGVVDAEVFDLLLTKERARADRVEGSFVLMVFEVAGLTTHEEHERATALLASKLVRRARTTDTVGWLDGRLGLLLTHTEAKHVPVIWRSIHEAFRRAMRHEMPELVSQADVEYSVYVYPGPSPARQEKAERPARSMQLVER